PSQSAGTQWEPENRWGWSQSEVGFADSQPQPSTEHSIQVRLAGDKRKHNEGRAEVYYNSQWGTICDDDFSIHSANVFCRQLGYVEAVSWYPGSKYGKGEGPIWLDNLYCTGRESSIAQCTSNGWGVSDCKHTEDVSVLCSEKRIPGFRSEDPLLNQIENTNIKVEDVRIRAVFSASRKRIPVTEGYVEIKEGGTWKQICDKNWTTKNSRVVCGMFGFPAEKKYNIRAYKTSASRRKHKYWAYSVICKGTESHLFSCKMGDRIMTLGGNVTCENGMPAVVSCSPGLAFSPGSHSGFGKAFRHLLVRLKGGAQVGEGRLEVLMNGEWGTICDDGWSLHSASVACRELGFGTAKEAILGARLGQGVQKQYECANFGEQGISVGCYDVYRHDIDCQWIDVTDLKQGDYIFRIIVNPNFEVAESDYSNNVMLCNVRYGSLRVWVYNCHIGKLANSYYEPDQKEYFTGLWNNQVF
uniref:Lysyl oxidase homolog n=1 Tax=Pseudonaja textilis TaxID=8673 RepID=A0A670Z804_PSETE